MCNQVYYYYGQAKKIGLNNVLNIKKKSLSNEICKFGTNPMDSVTWKKKLTWATLNLPFICYSIC